MSNGFEYLLDLKSGRVISCARFKSFGDIVEGRWSWIKDSIANHYDCNPDDVEMIETEEGDVLTAKGLPVAVHSLFASMETPVMAEAAE